MKIKVATTFRFKTDSNNVHNDERFVSSALTIEPDNPKEFYDEGCFCGTLGEVADNVCPERELCISSAKSAVPPSSVKCTPRFLIVGKPCYKRTELTKQVCEQFNCEMVSVNDLFPNVSLPDAYGLSTDVLVKNEHDIDHKTVLALLQEKLLSPSCKSRGYVIDGIPVHQELSSAVSNQLNDIVKMDNGPTHLIEINDSMTELVDITGETEDELLPVNLDISLTEELMAAKNHFEGEPPRIIMVGKPCTGKTTLARILCNLWGCHYVNASDLVHRCIEEKSGRGLEIIRQLQQGQDLSDATVFNILHEHLQSPECRSAGYILDGIPNYSEKLLNIQTQLKFLARIYPTPSLWVMIDISDPELRARWEGVRIDSSTGRLYSRLNYDASIEPSGRCDFPVIDEDTKARLMIRHEELPENLDLHFRFYNENVQQPLEELLNRFDSANVIRLDGTLCPVDLCQQLVSTLLDSSTKRISGPPSMSRVPSVEMQLLEELLATKYVWCNEPPRLVIFGKPCAKKTALARMLSNAWDCHYVSVAELISTHVERRTGTGLRILSLMHRGEVLPDSMIFEIVSNELLSTDCFEMGYILDGMPTSDEGMPSVPSQLEFLRHLLPRPRFWVYVDFPDSDHQEYCETAPLDHSIAPLGSNNIPENLRVTNERYDSPHANKEYKDDLLRRHDVLPEHRIGSQDRFIRDVSQPLEEFLSQCDPPSVIRLDGIRLPNDLALSLVEKIRPILAQSGLTVSDACHPYAPWARSSDFTTSAASSPPPGETTEKVHEYVRKRSPLDACMSPTEVCATDYKTGAPIESQAEPVCCCQCGAEFQQQAGEIWNNRIPRLLLIGKPCTGKTALAKQMCAAWGCELVNATELIHYHMKHDTEFGQHIKQLMQSGQDLDDGLVISMMQTKLNSPECMQRGFVIDDFPTYSEKSLSVVKQLEFLQSPIAKPEYIIDLQMPTDLLRVRWEAVRMDLESGALYVGQETHAPPGGNWTTPSCCLKPCVKSSELPPSQNQLFRRHEETVESMDANITFYQEVVEPLLRTWLESNFPDSVIPMDGDLSTEEVFHILQRKLCTLARNPKCPPRQLFTDKENSFLPGSCCRRCGVRYTNLEPSEDLWTEIPPRFVIFGKPCTGKTTLAKRLCTMWNCQLVNASELVLHHLNKNTATGQKIRALFESGQDLPDQFVIQMLNEKLASPACTEGGYVLDGIPTHSEKSKSIACQMEFLEQLDPRPDYVIDIRIPDSALRKRWETVRIDVADGTLYISKLHGQRATHPGSPCGRIVRQADFPEIDEETEERLITRYEELPENLDKHIPFYQLHVAPRVREFVQEHDQTKVIVLDGNSSPTKMLNTVIYKLNVMARNPGVPTSELFPEDEGGNAAKQTEHGCSCQMQGFGGFLPLNELWTDKQPRIILLGKPCTGKTTLAKRLCSSWNCELINASELLLKELDADTDLGRWIRYILSSGSDLPDHVTIDLIRSAICSPKCVRNGYILDGIPTHSELSKSIDEQLAMLRSFENGPEYIIQVEMSDEELRERWEAIRIDLVDGVLYPKQSYSQVGEIGTRIRKRGTRHPDFPVVDELTRNRLLTRHEELPENLDKHFEFYHRRMDGPIKRFVDSHDPAAVITVNGALSPSNLLQAVLVRFAIMARHPGVPTSILFPEDGVPDDQDVVDSCQCQCGDKQGFSELSRNLWKDRVPHVLVLGNSCCGKSTLAKRLCKEWNCIYINATEMIHQHIGSRSPIGDQIQEILSKGCDLSDDFVLQMLKNKLESPETVQNGYVLDDFPTSSEKWMSIHQQLDVLRNPSIRPDYIVDIQIPEHELKKRWESIRIDLVDGVLYPCQSILGSKGVDQRHPAFPAAKENIKQRLITRHEEIVENIDKQAEFYLNYVRPKIDEFLQSFDPSQVITLDGRKSIAEMCKMTCMGIRQHTIALGR